MSESRFKVVTVLGNERLSKTSPEVSVAPTYIFFNLKSRMHFFGQEEDIEVMVRYDDETNEYLIEHLGKSSEVRQLHSLSVKYGRISNRKIASEMLSKIGKRPTVIDDPMGMILRASEQNDS